MLWEAILLGIIIGWLRNGKLKYLNKVSLFGWPLIILALLLQTAIWIDFNTSSGYLTTVYPYIYLISFILLLLFIFLQNRQAGIIIVGLGILLNLLVITANRGMMPVDSTRIPPTVAEELVSGVKSPFYTTITDTTWLSYLGDRIPVPYRRNQLLSVGDIFIGCGILIFIQHNMLKKRQPKH